MQNSGKIIGLLEIKFDNYRIESIRILIIFSKFPGMPMIDFGSIQIPTGGDAIPGASGTGSAPGGGSMPDDPATIRQMLLNSPHDLAILKERNPPLAEALLSGSLGEAINKYKCRYICGTL